MEDIKKALLVFDGEVQTVLKSLKLVAQEPSKWTPAIAKLAASRESNRAVLYGRICSLFETYKPPRFPPSVYLHKLHTVAVAVAAAGDHALARDQCVARYLDGKIKWPADVDTEDQVTVMLVSALCNFHILVAADPNLSRLETLQTMQERCCDAIMAAMQTACPSHATVDDSGLRIQDKRYWLTFNATVTALTICQKLLSCGYASSCVQLALFCCAALESSVPLLQPAYLPWRARWYGVVCNAYHRSGSSSDGITYAKRAVQQIQTVASAIALDPVKPTAEMQQALSASETEAVALLVSLSCCHGSADITATLSEAKVASWPAPQKFAALCSAALQGTSRLEVSLANAKEGEDRPADTGAGKCIEAAYELAKPSLLEIFRHYEDAANAAAEAKPEVQAASQAVPIAKAVALAKAAYATRRFDSFRALATSCSVRLAKIVEWHDLNAADVANATAVHPVEGEVMPRVDALAHSASLSALRSALSLQVLAVTPGGLSSLPKVYKDKAPKDPEPPILTTSEVEAISLADATAKELIAAAATHDRDVLDGCALVVCRTLQPLLPRVHASVAAWKSASETKRKLWQQRVATAAASARALTAGSKAKSKPSTSNGADGAKPKTPAAETNAAAENDAAAAENAAASEDAKDDAVVAEEQAKDEARAKSAAEGSAVADGSSTWDDELQSDTEDDANDWSFETSLKCAAPAHIQASRSIVAAVSWLISSNFADALQVGIFAADAVQLLLLRGRVALAESIASSAVGYISSARFSIQKMCLPNAAFNPANAALTVHASWSVRCGDASASRRCYEELEQSLASLQIDLCRLEARARVRSAVANSRVRARKAAAKRAAARALRIQRTALYGELSKKEKRLFEEEEEADANLPVSVDSRADALVASYLGNNAERAIMLLELSSLPASATDQRALVARAWESALAAETYEIEGIQSLEAAFRVDKKKTHSSQLEPPPAPAVLLCGCDGIAVASTSNRSSFYAIYAKPEGSGTALSLNNIELFNSGIAYAAQIPVVISGLTRNEKYIFAVAEVGEEGKVKGTISEKSVAAVAATPLPSLCLFCLIALRAYDIGDVALGNKVIQKVSDVILRPGLVQELHLQAPFNRDTFIPAAADMAPRCALRLVQQALCAFTNVRLEKLQVENFGNGLRGTLTRQLEFVELSKRVFVAAQCAAASDDTTGVRLCLSLMYRCISPLLHLSPRPLTVAHALCGCNALSQFLLQQQQLPAPDELFMPFGHDDISRRVAAAVAYEAANVLLDNREEKAASVLCVPALKQAADVSSVLTLRPHVALPAPAVAAPAPAAAAPAKGKGPAAPEPVAAPPPKKGLPPQKALVPAPDAFPEGRALIMWGAGIKSGPIESGFKDTLATLTGGAALDAAVLSLIRGQLTADVVNNAISAALKEPLHPRCAPLSVLVLRSALRSRVLRAPDGSSSLFDLADKVIKQCVDTRIALQGERKRWAVSDDVPAICHTVLSTKDITAPNKRTEFKMPGLEPSAEEQTEATADAQAAAAAEAQRADEELQAIEIDDAEIQKRAAAAAEREQRAQNRALLQKDRAEARRTAAAGQLQKLLPLFIGRIRERRALRVCISYDTPWIATLQQFKALEAFDLARTAKSAALAIPSDDENAAARDAANAQVADLAMRVLTALSRCSVLGARAGCVRIVTDAMATAWNTYWELKAFLGTKADSAKAFGAIGGAMCEVLDACRLRLRSDEDNSSLDEAALVMQSLQTSSKHLRGGAKALPRPSPAPAKIWFESPLSPEVDFAAKFVLLAGSLLDAASLPTHHVILSQRFHDVTEKQFFGREMDQLISAAEAAASRLNSVKDNGKSLLGESIDQVLARLQKTRAAIARDRAKIDSLIDEMRVSCRQLPPIDEAPVAPSVRPKTAGSRPSSASATLMSLSPAASSLQNVISQYDSSISVLRYRRDTPRLVPALLELGMLHWKKGDRGKAVVAWNDAVDSAFSSLQMLKNWRRVVSELQCDRAPSPALHSDSSVVAAARWDAIARAVDAPILIAAAIACGCLSRFGYMEDERNANEASQLTALLISSLASGSLSHPQVPFAFATVCPKTIAPPPESRGATPATTPAPSSSTGGVLRLFLQREVADAAQLVQVVAVCGLRLLQAGQPSIALPAVVIGMHVARDVLRDVKMYAHLSVIRARLSTRMGSLPAAVADLVSLFNGRGLPDLFNDSASVIPKKAAAAPVAVDPKAKAAPPPAAPTAAVSADPPAFNDTASADSPDNLPVYSWIADVASACLAHVFDGVDTPGVSLYDSSTVALMTLTCIELLHASVPPNITASDDAAALSSPSGRLARSASLAEKLLQKCKEGLAAARPADATWRTAIAARCYIFVARFKMRCGLLTSALAVVSEAIGLLNSSEAVVWGRTIADFRSMCCGSTWIELLAIRAGCLLAQGRIADAASASEAGLKHGAQCNEQRWTSVCSEVRLWTDVAQGKTDPARMQCEAITGTIRNLHSFDTDACLALASLSSFLTRMVDRAEAGSTLIEEANSIVLSHLVDYGIEASRNRYFPGMHIQAMLLCNHALIKCRLGAGGSSAHDAAAHAASLASKGLQIVAQMPLPDFEIFSQLLFARIVAVRRILWSKHAVHNGKGHLSLSLAASTVEEAKKELFPSYPATGDLPDVSSKGFISMLHQETAPEPSLALALSDAKQLVGLLCARKPSEIGLLRDVFLEVSLIAFLCDDAAKAALCLSEAASLAAFMKRQATTVLPAAKSDASAAAPAKGAPPAKGAAPAAASSAFNLPPFVQSELEEASALYMSCRNGGDAPDPGAASALSLFSLMSAMRREATVLPCEIASLRLMHAASIHAALIAGSPEYLSIAWPSASATTSADSFVPDRVVSGWLHVGFGSSDSRYACLAVNSDDQQGLRVSLWSPALLTERRINRCFVLASEVVVAPAAGQDLDSLLARSHGSGGAANADTALPVLAELCPQNEKFISEVQVSQWDHVAAFFDKSAAAADSNSSSISSLFRQLVSK